MGGSFRSRGRDLLMGALDIGGGRAWQWVP